SLCFFFFSSRRRHTRFSRDWSSDVCSSDLEDARAAATGVAAAAIAAALRVPAAEIAVGAGTLAGEVGRAGETDAEVARDRALPEIGRASCRERGKIAEVGG